MSSPLSRTDAPHTAFSNPDPFAKSDHENGDSSRRNANLDGINEAQVPPGGLTFERIEAPISEDEVREADTPSDKDSQKDLDKMATFKSKLKHAADKIHLDSIKATGVSRLFNPTRVRMHIRVRGDSEEQTNDSGKMIDLLWRARDNRKGRNSIAVPYSGTLLPEVSTMDNLKSTFRDIGKTLLEMSTTFPYWDMAFWSGWSYTIGSALFVIDGAFAWGPLRFPSTSFSGEAKYGVPLCFFFGAIFYQIGAVMAYLEAVNDGSFHGSAMRRLMDGDEEVNKQMLDEKLHSFFGHLVPHHHRSGEEDIEADAEQKAKAKAPRRRRGGIDLGGEEGEFSPYLTWRWWPTWHVLRTHHIYEIGYLACTIQLFGVTLYGITAIVVLPGILDSLNEWQTNGAYWIPQMVAAACFLIASIMFMFETQEKWYQPTPGLIGWWIGAWSIAGSVGFELSAGFGPTGQGHSWAEYQSSLSSMWGSAAYLVGSFLQWYEAVNKNPEVVLGI